MIRPYVAIIVQRRHANHTKTAVEAKKSDHGPLELRNSGRLGAHESKSDYTQECIQMMDVRMK